MCGDDDGDDDDDDEDDDVMMMMMMMTMMMMMMIEGNLGNGSGEAVNLHFVRDRLMDPVRGCTPTIWPERFRERACPAKGYGIPD